MQDLAEIKITAGKGRAAVMGIALIAIILGWASISMQFGGLLGETTTAIEPYANDIARLALRLAPGDPQAHNLAALTGNDLNEALGEAEEAVGAAPNDFRWRVALGRAYEQAERAAAAENQFLAAVDLAPNYAYTRWNLGNFYLRQDRESEAIEELRKATVGHLGFREQVFSLAWDYFDGDPDLVERATSDDDEARAYLARFFAQRGKGAAALRTWNQLDAGAKQTYRLVGSLVALELYGKGNYPESQEVARQMGESDSTAEVISNPSFEEPLADGTLARFGWQIVPADNRVEISADSQNKFAGTRSIRLAFRGAAKAEYANLYQTVVVKPQTNYEISFWYRTDGLRSPVRPSLQVVSANDNRLLASTEMFPADSREWQKIVIPFNTGAVSTAISVRTFRPFCGEQCTVAGSLWYDQFELSRK